MQLAAPLLATLTSVLLLRAAAVPSAFCFRAEQQQPGGELHHSFLSPPPPGPAPSPIRLYHTVWSSERALLRCVWSDDEGVTRSYASVCARGEEFGGSPDEHAGSLFVAREGQCTRVVSLRGQRSEVSRGPRAKRSFIVPGTLWCGSGNKAPSYQDLGVFSATDRCCREHDQCQHTIPSFHSQFGVFNTNIFTMSHCDCDSKFRSCLKEADNSISDVVGYTFFNLLKMRCFSLSHRLQCTHRNWFGLCKERGMVQYAVVHPPTLYTSDNQTFNNSSDADPQTSNSTAAPPPPAVPRTVINPNTSTSSEGDGPERPAGGATAKPPSQLENSLKAGSGTAAEPEAGVTDTHGDCDVYQVLDQCGDIIPPQRSRHGLHNSGSRTLFHCNCSRRFLQTMAEQRRPSRVHAALLRHVSPSCFLPEDCTAAHTCSAVLVKLPESDSVLEQQRPPVGRRLRMQRRGKPQPVRLYRLCVRMSRHTQSHGAARGDRGPHTHGHTR